MVDLGNYKWEQHGKENDTNDQIIIAFNDLLGRWPTQQELAQAYPIFAGGDPHRVDTASGRAYVANLKTAEENTPDKLYAKQQAQYAADAPNHYGDVNTVFNDLLKRGASKQELDHFGKMLASGEVDPYELQSFVKTLPEYTNTQDQQFRAGLNKELEGYDQSYFDKAKESIISRYAQMGRSTSPSLDYALTDLAKQITDQRNQYLTGLSASQYSSNKDLATKNYQDTMDRYFNLGDYALKTQMDNQTYARDRSDNVADYNRQMTDYLNMMSRQRKSGLGSAIGGVVGGAIGSYWGPAGATAGMGVGQGAGGLFDYFNR